MLLLHDAALFNKMTKMLQYVVGLKIKEWSHFALTLTTKVCICVGKEKWQQLCTHYTSSDPPSHKYPFFKSLPLIRARAEECQVLSILRVTEGSVNKSHLLHYM